MKSFPLPTDDFERLGICPKSFKYMDELEFYLRKVVKAKDLKRFYKPVDSKYIEIPRPSPGIKFLKLLEDIIHKR